jgi:transketolase
MRDAFARTFYDVAKADPRIFMVVADISPASKMANFKEEFPSRFVDVGVAEQTLIGLSAGLALRGYKPFAYTIANFTIYRPFEQVRNDLCYQNLPVTVVGVGGGLSYSSLGGTHHTIEDVCVMSAIPNMSILAPCDPLEVDESVKIAAAYNGPMYLRLGKAGEPNLTAEAPEPFAFGKLRMIRPGNDICILSYGPIMKLAFEVASGLQRDNSLSSAIFSVSTLKPLDRERIESLLRAFKTVVIIEEHVERGGLGAQVKQIAWDMGAACKLYTFHLRDEFLHVYGTQDDLRRAHGLSTDRIIRAVAER